MNKSYLAFALLFSCLTSMAQVPDSGTFLLHKFAQNIGKETYHISRSRNEMTWNVNFKFVDRGSPVPLKTRLVTTLDNEPLGLVTKGSTSRFSTIDDSVAISQQTAFIRTGDSAHTIAINPFTFPVDGYSPGTVQMALIQYWKKHGEPATISMLPAGEAAISDSGIDTLAFNNQQLVFNRIILSGLVWGNEIAWTDNSGQLICLITNDAEGDKLEMLKEEYETLLPEFISRAAIYGMKLFSSSMKMNTESGKTIAIVGGNIIDVEGGKNISNSTIIIEDGLIKQTGKTGSIKIPAEATIIHAEGKTILPGLWDMHAHFEQAEWGPAYLAAGVTTVRDCGNEFGYINAIKASIDAHNGVGPLILKAGIIDGPGPIGLGIVRASTPEEAIKAVNMYKDNGFVQIKIYSSVRPPIVKAICNEAHRLGLTVTGHIPNFMTTKAGIDSGMDQINHMQYIFASLKKNADKSVMLNDSSNLAFFDYLKSRKVVVDPTVGVFEMILRSVKDNILDMEPNYYKLPVPLQSVFSNMGMEPDKAEKQKPMMTSMLRLVKVLYDKGITIVAGTDMGFPGYSLARELELYVQGGLTPLEAIKTATIVPAKVMKMNKTSGSVKPGKQANLVILNSNPLDSIRNIRDVWMVIKEGQQYDPEMLHKMVGFK